MAQSGYITLDASDNIKEVKAEDGYSEHAILATGGPLEDPPNPPNENLTHRVLMFGMVFHHVLPTSWLFLWIRGKPQVLEGAG